MTGWDDETGFKVVPKGWMLNLHLLGLVGVVDEVKTLTCLVSTSENMIYIAMIQLIGDLLSTQLRAFRHPLRERYTARQVLSSQGRRSPQLVQKFGEVNLDTISE